MLLQAMYVVHIRIHWMVKVSVCVIVLVVMITGRQGGPLSLPGLPDKFISQHITIKSEVNMYRPTHSGKPP